MLIVMFAFTQCGGDPPDPEQPPEDTRIKDGDGNVYTDIEIGEQKWLKENLKTTKYNDGTPIVNPTANSAWESSTSGAYCWYDNSESHKNTYGALYNYHAAATGRVCPKGWHVPSVAEWSVLINANGKEATAGGKLKEKGTDHWDVGAGATDEVGFTALPNGRRMSDGTFDQMRFMATFWTREVGGIQTDAAFHYMETDKNSVTRAEAKKECGFAIRCIKD